MIKKIIKIKNVGKFQDYFPKAKTHFNGELKKFTLIYGDNGIGKTTFTSILKSLKNDDRLLKRMRSFGCHLSPEIKLLIEHISKPFEYSNYIWNEHRSDIEIFDKSFIYDNVYTGFEVKSEHRRRLFDLILGQRGVEIKKEIEIIKENIQKDNENLKDIKKEIDSFMGEFINVEQYRSLEPPPDIRERIRKKEEEIEIVRANKEIKEKSKLREIQNDKLLFDFRKISEILKKSINTISEEYLGKVELHKQHLGMGIEAEQWIKEGYESIKNNKCPFCLRPFDKTTDIVKAYEHYFSEEYINLQKDIREIKDLFFGLNIQLIFSEFEKTNTFNFGLVEFWKTYTKTEFYNKPLFNNKDSIIDLFNKVNTSIIKKSNNPIQSCSIDDLSRFEKLTSDFSASLEEYNSSVEEFNDKIEEIKKIPSKNIEILKNELDSLKMTEKRYTTEGVELFSKYFDAETILTELNDLKKEYKEKLEKYTKAIFSKYGKNINKYLEKFTPDLKIKQIKHGYVGTSKVPQVDYVLSVLDNEVRLDDDGYSPTFNHVMSEGDKSTLAFSLFLATLETDGNIANKVVVFDDPVASFDLNRKSATISVLNQIGAVAKQLIVLTHSCLFAGKLWQEYVDKSDSLCLQIRNIGKSSHFDEYKVDSETLLGIYKDMNQAKQYLETGARDDTERKNIVRCIRPILEGYYRIKFYGEIELDDMLGEIIRKINEANEGDKLFIMQEHISKLDDINRYSRKYYHAFNTAADEEPILDGELKPYIQKTFTLIEES